jgi:hypothetical protein
MATLVFDIETSAQPIENFDDTQQEYLFRETEKLGDEIAKNAKREEITRFMSLWPFTSQVVCIAMLNAETQRGQSLFVAEDFEEVEENDAPVKFIPCADETELLTQFWEVAKKYDSCRSFICARRCSMCPSRKKTGSATVTPSSRIATSRSNSPFTA